MAGYQKDGGGLLTDHQREVFSAIVSEREEAKKETTGPRPPLEHATKHPAVPPKHHTVVSSKQERKSHAATNGKPKKGGVGGKGAWGNPLDLRNYEVDMDPGDPSYESDEEPYGSPLAPVAQSLEAFKSRVNALIQDYFSGGDEAAASADLRDLSSPHLHHHFVKRLVSLALDRHAREREAAARLLSGLYPDALRPEAVRRGFLALLLAADDLQLDCPGVEQELGAFMARAVVDDVLPPAFLAWVVNGAGGSKGRWLGEDCEEELQEGLSEDSKGLEAVRFAQSLLSEPHHAERVEKWWGGSPGLAAGQITVEAAKERIGVLLEECVVSGDVAEASRCVREMNLPFFHHEVVKAAILKIMESGSSSGNVDNSATDNGGSGAGRVESMLLAFLKEAADEGLLSLSQISKGFGRVSGYLDDLALDIPNARASFERICSRGAAEGWLTSSPLSQPQAREEQDSQQLSELRGFKKRCTSIVAEYFDSADAADVARSLQELGFTQFRLHFVRRLVSGAMDRRVREKEMASQLLSALYGECLAKEDVEGGFSALLAGIEDLALDYPRAPHELGLFIARAVVDDILAPHYVTEKAAEGKLEGEGAAAGALAAEVLHTVETMLGARHAGERILRCWLGVGGEAGAGPVAGGGVVPAASGSVDEAKERIQKLLEEYEVGGGEDEACDCLRELGMPFFHHEVVKQALIRSMEHGKERPLDLLRHFSGVGAITTSQMLKGFVRVADYLPDFSLDVPNAHDKFSAAVARAQAESWLSSEFKAPTRDITGA